MSEQGARRAMIRPRLDHLAGEGLRDWYSWLTNQEAAALSGYDIQQMRRLKREGKIGTTRKGHD